MCSEGSNGCANVGDGATDRAADSVNDDDDCPKRVPPV